MPQLNYSVNVNGLGGAITQNTPRVCDGGDSREIALPPGYTGVLTTRTSASVGTFTMTPGHGITTGMSVDVYWAGGVRYGVTVGTVATNSVPVTSGAGDDLPAASTAVVMTPRVTINVSIDGDNVALLGINQKYPGTSVVAASHIEFLDVTPATVAELDLEANTPQVFDIAGGSSNPFTGNPIVSAKATNGSSTTASTLQIYFVQDTTP